MRMIVGVLLITCLTATASMAESCERYRFGTVGLWNCKANQGGGSN